jgi:hypothetical protein
MAARMMEPDPDADLLFLQADPNDPAIVEIAGDRKVYLWRDGRLVAAKELPVTSHQ